MLEQRGEAWRCQKVTVAQMIYGHSGTKGWDKVDF